ncbi:fumarylacetoacetase [Chloracidobacterium sp. MS 40/45]|uniref:fumarylacetoacetase n=1 Tax=Chloracidobacterium aggregatum TaxID=2851959 RepID=UPI001B8D1B59|nr:fumarylacetoacetase [Chloracidobacterium aggregatum]QUW01270.1 fumarylacetoacetase [Chloracidobacterium sp. MS 40/45]
MTDVTHDAHRRSWVMSANAADTDFPLQNLPLGRFSEASQPGPRLGVAIGDQVLDLTCLAATLSPAEAGAAAAFFAACATGEMATVCALPPEQVTAGRRWLSDAMWEGAADTAAHQARLSPWLLPQAAVTLHRPLEFKNYTDFYASVFHATNVGAMFRPDNPLLPNYRYIPIGYHGRASSVVVSGTPVRRPWGQTRPNPEAPPVFGPSRSLDYELEVGILVGRGNRLGEPVPIARAGEQLFGLCLLNDWSARDIQAWEYQPLGPFLSKSFATSVSPWVVMRDALAPFRCPAMARAEGDPAPLDYLWDEADQAGGGFDVTLEVHLTTARMREHGLPPVRLSQSRLRDLYWTPAQMIAHHTSNGCDLQPGDLLGSGTVSGPTKDARGCLLELTWRGSEPLALPSGETRRFLEDGDEVTLRGFCERDGFRRIGFGECCGRIEG